MINYSQQQKVYCDEGFEVDLIRQNNIWERTDAVFHGSLGEFGWSKLQAFFNVARMTADLLVHQVPVDYKVVRLYPLHMAAADPGLTLCPDAYLRTLTVPPTPSRARSLSPASRRLKVAVGPNGTSARNRCCSHHFMKA
jgi:hypothetical protein